MTVTMMISTAHRQVEIETKILVVSLIEGQYENHIIPRTLG